MGIYRFSIGCYANNYKHNIKQLKITMTSKMKMNSKHYIKYDIKKNIEYTTKDQKNERTSTTKSKYDIKMTSNTIDIKYQNQMNIKTI